MDTTSHLPGKIQGTKHAKQSVWSDQKPDQQSDPSVTRPVGDVASTTDAAHVGPKQTIVASKAGNNKSPFGIGQTLRPIFVYSRDDLGFAQMFHRRFGHYFRFDHERGQWLAWDVRKKRWVTGRLATTIMMRFVKKVITELYSLAQSRRPLRTRNGETVTPEEALAWAKSASQKSRQKAMLELVRDFAGVRVSKDELDSDPFLLGVANGVVDHRTGTLIENRPELLITRYAKASYLPDANAEGNKASNFQRSIGQICLGRQDLVDFLQEVFGYSLSGLIKEHAFFLLVGTGANGKSTRDILVNDPVALERYSFVWQFKMPPQYEIWKTLYEKYEFNRIIRHRAIGGMVALRGITGIKFSPFIGMAYRCFLDYLDAGRFDQGFSLHFLGMYLPYDRFEMAILDGLFDRYLEGEAQVVTTYDSINPLQSARVGKDIPLFEFTGTGLSVHDNLVDAPVATLELVYGDPDLIKFVQKEIARRRDGRRLINADSFGALNIHSHREVNRFFEYVVAAHGLAEVFFREWSLTKINGHFTSVLAALGKANTCSSTSSARMPR